MSLSFPAYFLHLKHPFVKIHNRSTHNKLKYRTLSVIVWHLWQQKDKNSCNARVRVRTREGVISVILRFKILAYGLRVALRFLHIRTCTKNNTSFWWKQHVVLVKTTRHFEENDTSFWRKQAGVLYKSPHWWKQRKNPADTTCINISIKRIIEGQKPRSCAKSERREVEKQRKSKEDIAKQKRHLSPICLKKVYWSDQIDVFNPLKDQKVKTNW